MASTTSAKQNATKMNIFEDFTFTTADQLRGKLEAVIRYAYDATPPHQWVRDKLRRAVRKIIQFCFPTVHPLRVPSMQWNASLPSLYFYSADILEHSLYEVVRELAFQRFVPKRVQNAIRFIVNYCCPKPIFKQTRVFEDFSSVFANLENLPIEENPTCFLRFRNKKQILQLSRSDNYMNRAKTIEKILIGFSNPDNMSESELYEYLKNNNDFPTSSIFGKDYCCSTAI